MDTIPTTARASRRLCRKEGDEMDRIDKLEQRVKALEEKMTELSEVVRPDEISLQEVVARCVDQALHSGVPLPQTEVRLTDSIFRK